MTNKTATPEPTQQDFVTKWEANPDLQTAPALSLNEILKAGNMYVPHIKMEELIDQSFTIYEFKEFPSSYPGQEKALFAGCRDEAGKPFTTVIGGQALMDALDKVAAIGMPNPVKVILRHKTGGNFGGYYIFE